MNMKPYERAEMEIIILENVDVITESKQDIETPEIPIPIQNP